jgi:RNase H-fold protein (predicted Holliday junction resolvase)
MSISTSKKPSVSHILGVDFGKAKIGLAIADSETRIAFGYGLLKNDKDLLKNLSDIVEKEGIEKIVIGNNSVETLRWSVSDGSRTEIFHSKTSQRDVSTRQDEKIKDLASLLKKKLNIPIEFQSEIFSTQLAERNLKEKGAKKIKRFDDQEAARIILQSWLDRSRNM